MGGPKHDMAALIHSAAGRGAEAGGGVATQVAPESRNHAAFWLCVIAGAVSVALRAVYLTESWRINLSVPRAFVAAEGVIGITARDILHGAHPVFWADQGYYHGAIEAYVAALMFRLFGESMTTLRLAPTLLAVLWVPLTGLLAARLYGKRAGYLAAALVALPTQFVFEWGCTAWSGASRIMWLLICLYVLILLLERITAWRIIALGFMAGMSVWASLLSLAMLPIYGLALVAWVRLSRRQWGLLVIAGMLGMAPLIYGNVREPLVSARALAARARLSLLWRSRAAKLPEEQGREHFFHSVPLFQVLGAQPRHDGKWSMSGSAAALFLTVGTVAGGLMGCRRRLGNPFVCRGTILLLACVGAGLLSGVPGFWGEPVARYSVGLYPPACALVAGWLAHRWPRFAVPVVALLALVNVVQLAEPIQAEARTPGRMVTDALREHGLHYGFGADSMYDLVFETGEQVIIQPIEWTWVAHYDALVLGAGRPFYLYRDDQQHKVSYQIFMNYLASHGIRYQRFDVAEYHVLYDFEPAGAIDAQALREIRAQIRYVKGRSRRRLS